jgi:hypothetical protein
MPAAGDAWGRISCLYGPQLQLSSARDRRFGFGEHAGMMWNISQSLLDQPFLIDSAFASGLKDRRINVLRLAGHVKVDSRMPSNFVCNREQAPLSSF